jgi:hypothetical protein
MCITYYSIYGSVDGTIVLLAVTSADTALEAARQARWDYPSIANTVFALPYPEQELRETPSKERTA